MSDEEHSDSEFYYSEQQETAEERYTVIETVIETIQFHTVIETVIETIQL